MKEREGEHITGGTIDVVVVMISTPYYCIRSLRSPSFCFCTKSTKKTCWLLWFPRR